MMGIWILDRGDFALFASLMTGGYLAAAVLLYYLPARSPRHEALRFSASLAVIIAALLPALSPFSLIIGIAAAAAAWGISTTLSGYRMIAAHLLLLVAASFVVGAQSVTDTWIDYWREDPIGVSRIGVYLAAYALVTAPAAHAIAWLLRRIDLSSDPPADVGAIHESPSNHPLSLAGEGKGEGEPAQANRAGTEPRSTSPARGRIIGILERVIILTLALLGQWQAAGLVIAAKSIARFRNLEDRNFAEYYLVGTLASLLIAFLVAATALALT